MLFMEGSSWKGVRPLILFAPGAGAPSTHPWMERWRRYLSGIGEVVLFDYSYVLAGSRRPDPLPKLIETHRRALAAAGLGRETPVILAGKSMGSRIGCHLSLVAQVDGLVCFGYPLCAAGDPGRMRDKVLRELTTPVLFVQGTRDPLCPLDLLEKVRAEMKAPNALHVVAGGDHSLSVAKRVLKEANETQEQVDERMVAAVRNFLEVRLA